MLTQLTASYKKISLHLKLRLKAKTSKKYIKSMLIQCWPIVFDSGLYLK